MRNQNKRKKSIFWVLLLAALVWYGGLAGSGRSTGGTYTVQAATTNVVARFWNTNGKPVYNQIRIKTVAGKKIKLPSVPSVKGYQNLGWSTKKNATKATYKAGQSITLKKNLSLYAVRKKVGTYKVTFYNSNGASGTAFKKLNKTVTKNGYMTMPAVPSKSGYESLGWSTSKNASRANYAVGKKVRIKKSQKLYAVYKKNATVILCKNNGSAYKTVSVTAGSTYKLPSVSNASGYTFMGWDYQPGKRTAPRYEAGETITVKGNMKLYAVVFNRKAEEELSESALLASSGWRIGNGSADKGYNHIIFVGDSRTVRMQLTLQQQFGTDSNILRDIDFVCQEGQGLSWLKSEGMTSILSKAEAYYSVQRPTAVIFNLGVNDPGQMYNYVTYLKQIAGELQKKNCKLFFMSVNPVNSKVIQVLGYNKLRTEAVVRKFNTVVSTGLRGTYTYIDTYSYLLNSGYGTNRGGGGVDVAVDDGLHYTTKTYKRIFKYCLDFLSEH